MDIHGGITRTQTKSATTELSLLITSLGNLLELNCKINALGLSFDVFYPESGQFPRKTVHFPARRTIPRAAEICGPSLDCTCTVLSDLW